MQNGYYNNQGINKRVLAIVFLGISILWYVYASVLSVSGFISLRDLIQQVLMIVSAVIMIVYMAMNHKSNSGRILFCVASAIAAFSSIMSLPLILETISYYFETFFFWDDDYFDDYFVLQLIYMIFTAVKYIFGAVTFAVLAILSFVKKPLRGLKISLCIAFAVLVIASFAVRFAMYITLDAPYFGITIIQTLAWYIPDLFLAAALIVYFAANRTYGPEKNAAVHTMPYAVYSPASIEQSIFALKASFERGEIPEAEYQIRRQELLKKL
ncbi:MAG: hypothetical protein E7613_10265 [Ruminococcaceae bacterium]|nr:hypothetical protein [Oscillospiraceae bacterium]